MKVILDVVFNHTAEGNELGPTLSFRGIDNPAYYLLTGDDDEPRRYYTNYTGTGNTLDFDSPVVVDLVLDSRCATGCSRCMCRRVPLRSGVGARPDRVSIEDFETDAPFFRAVRDDPILADVVLIAEPWTWAPIRWATSRRTGRSGTESSEIPCAASPKATTTNSRTSADGSPARPICTATTGVPFNSINFITCHDGFTLNDLVSYDNKHNEANGDTDGTIDNNSWNCGVEGPTDDPTVIELRKQIVKNHLCRLLTAAGTPMLLGGDEFLRTQGGNNNAYCQDNEISWFDWTLAEKNSDILEFASKAIGLTRRLKAFRHRKYLSGADEDPVTVSELTWFGADGEPAELVRPPESHPLLPVEHRG